MFVDEWASSHTDLQNLSDLLNQVTSIPGKPQASDTRVGLGGIKSQYGPQAG